MTETNLNVADDFDIGAEEIAVFCLSQAVEEGVF